MTTLAHLSVDNALSRLNQAARAGDAHAVVSANRELRDGLSALGSLAPEDRAVIAARVTAGLAEAEQALVKALGPSERPMLGASALGVYRWIDRA